MRTYKAVRGMRDYLPEALAKRHFVEDKVRECFSIYGYEEIGTPVLESMALLSAKAGDEIRHRMYTFKDLGGRQVALRPEITPSIARVVTNELRTEAKPLRLGYIANCFRYDNPQMGRYREFWQAGFELFGSTQTVADAEILTVNNDLMRRVGFSDFFIKMGHMGIIREVLNQEAVEENLQNVVMGLMDKRRWKKVYDLLGTQEVSHDCLTMIKKLFTTRGTNWKKVLSKGRRILHQNEEALSILTKMEEIINLTQASGVTTELYLDLGFARGLEYYTGMIFEIFVPDLGVSLVGGGRYDKLVELFGGEPTPAVGSAPGIDRMVLAMEKKALFQKNILEREKTLIISVNHTVVSKALEIANALRRQGVVLHYEAVGRSVSAALSYADKKQYKYAIIVGPKELMRNAVILRDLVLKKQREVPIPNLINELKHT